MTSKSKKMKVGGGNNSGWSPYDNRSSLVAARPPSPPQPEQKSAKYKTTTRTATGRGTGICRMFGFLRGIESLIATISDKIVKNEANLAKFAAMATMPINIVSLIILVFILLIMFFKLLSYILNGVGLDVNMNPLHWIPGKTVFYWIASFYKLILNLSMLVAILFGMARIYKSMTEGSDSLYALIVMTGSSSSWVYLLLGFIFGNGLVMGLYKMVCKPNYPNLSGIVNIVNGILGIIIVCCICLMILFRLLGCDDTIIIHKVLLIGSISYFIYQALLYGSEYIISENLYYLLGDADVELSDCNKEDDDESSNVKIWINRILAILIWPIIVGVIVLQGLPQLMSVNSSAAQIITRVIGRISSTLLGNKGKGKK